MSKDLMAVEFKSLSGIMVQLDAETVRNTLTRGNGKVSDQEVAMFLRTCQAKQLDPLENGEVYLIKYDDKAPAQLVVGCHAYIRRADHFPQYRGYKSGITVVRKQPNGEVSVVQKEGSCVYRALGEELIGGWCRVLRERSAGNVEETFVEVSLEEYSTGQSNWRAKPATMIQKVAKSQAFRAAFPNEYEGIYTVDEMQASGAIPADYVVIEETGEVKEVRPPKDEPITQEQRQELFRLAKEVYGTKANDRIKELIAEEGYDSTAKVLTSAYNRILEKIQKDAVSEGTEPDGEPAPTADPENAPTQE